MMAPFGLLGLGLAAIILTLKQGDALGNMNALSAMYGSTTGTDGYYGLCAIQPGTNLLECQGNYYNYTNPPKNISVWAVTGGGYFTCALTYASRNPICWGDTGGGDKDTPQVLAIPAKYRSTRYSSISAGLFHVCAIRDDGSGTTDCWGSNTDNDIFPPSTPMKALAAGDGFTYGLKLQDGTSYIWGSNWKGYAKIWANDPQSQYSAIFAGRSHVCGIELITNKSLCWGMNDAHQCDVPANYTFSSLALGENYTCGLRTDSHEVVCWGDNTYGQCNPASGVPFAFITAADSYTCGVRKDQQSILCWGNYAGNANHLVCSAGICQGSCKNYEYYLAGKCPRETEKICLDCSSCPANMVQSSPCGSTNDTLCIPSPPKPPPSPSPFPPSPSPPSPPPPSPPTTYIIVGLSVGGSVLVALIVIFLYVRRHSRPSNIPHNIQEFRSSAIQEATSSYSEEMVLGRGASCLVYKGVFKNGEIVAVKKAIDAPHAKLFEQELQLLRRLNHVCLVNLIGYCRHDKILIFEFMENGSLFDCLFKKRSPELDWRTRIKIAAQAARGLVYLHNDVRPSIIHRDVKSANVLLDKNWDAHVSDFGISLFGPDVGDTHVMGTSIVGTPGYVDPEYTQTSILTAKSDVYSFGVVILELLSGKTAYMKGQESTLAGWASTVFESGNNKDILDPLLIRSTNTFLFHEVLELAFACVQPKREDRPTMIHISRKLESCLERIVRDEKSSSITP